MICLKRTQDIDGKDDPFCVACWEESEEGLNDFVPSKYYVDREDCMAEFCVTEEEFDKICQKVFTPCPKRLFLTPEMYWPKND